MNQQHRGFWPPEMANLQGRRDTLRPLEIGHLANEQVRRRQKISLDFSKKIL
jgi:hypothetical protein